MTYHIVFLILRLFELGFQNLLIRHQAKKLRYINVYILNNPILPGRCFHVNIESAEPGLGLIVKLQLFSIKVSHSKLWEIIQILDRSGKGSKKIPASIQGFPYQINSFQLNISLKRMIWGSRLIGMI